MKVAENDTLCMSKGYKQTEVGLIPWDWEVKSLVEIGKFSKGSGVRKDEATSGEIPCIRYGEIYTKHNDYIKQFYSFISQEVSYTAKRLKRGDILFAGSGETKEEIGKSVTFINDFEAYAGGDIVILSSSIAEPLYLGYLLNAPFIQKQKASRGQGDAVVHISATQLGAVKIPIPPTKAEQTAIATALSDADALISSLEKLIAKKRNIKQGAMQKLLEPREDWEVKRLGEVGIIVTGSTPPTQIKEFWNGSIPWITPTDILNNQKDIFRSEREITNTGLQIIRKLPANTLLVTCIASIGKNAILRSDGACNQQINAIITNSENSVDFLYFLIENSKAYLIGKAGTTATMMISKKEFSEITYSFPDLMEQTHIATILSDMDAEINALETKLEKYKKVKLGMMQELLTGRIRLV